MVTKRKFKRDVSEAVHSSAAALYKVGAIDKATMESFDARRLAPTPTRDAEPDPVIDPVIDPDDIT